MDCGAFPFCSSVWVDVVLPTLNAFGTGPDTGGVCLGSRLRRYRP
jgi:hypothetical protein